MTPTDLLAQLTEIADKRKAGYTDAVCPACKAGWARDCKVCGGRGYIWLPPAPSN
jgi:hypothetical protein